MRTYFRELFLMYYDIFYIVLYQYNIIRAPISLETESFSFPTCRVYIVYIYYRRVYNALYCDMV